MVNIRKSPLVQAAVSPREKFVACSSDGCASVTGSDGGLLKAGSGECLPEMSGSGLPVAATRHWDDLQVQGGSVPVENLYGNQVDTTNKIMAQDETGQRNIKRQKDATGKGKAQVLGYVPTQIGNLSLEEIELSKQMYVGVASHIVIGKLQECEECEVNPVLRDDEVTSREFEDYLGES